MDTLQVPRQIIGRSKSLKLGQYWCASLLFSEVLDQETDFAAVQPQVHLSDEIWALWFTVAPV